MLKQRLTGKDFAILDSIRGIASLYVAIAHCRGVLWIGGNEFTKMFPRETWSVLDYFVFGTSMLTRLAVEFVIVFFVLSGFSIAHSLSAKSSPLEFYKRRFIRIYPSYVVALGWAGLVFLITLFWHSQWYDGSLTTFSFVRTIEMNSFFKWEVLWKNLFYMPGTGFITPFWSLTYEVIFYLLAPFLVRRGNAYFIVSIFLFLINLLFPKQIASIAIPNYLFQFLFVYNIYFVLGVMIYKYYEIVKGFFSRVSKLAFTILIGIILLAMYAVNFIYNGESTTGFIISALLGIALIVYFLQFSIKIGWLMKIGRYSYTLYITHVASIYLYLAIYWWLFKPSAPFILNFMVWIPAVFFCLAIAYIQYRLVENKTKIVLSRLRNKKETVSLKEKKVSLAEIKEF